MNWYTVFFIMVLLITADKVLTVINIKLVQKNNPGVNALSIEQNPVNKFLFEKFGLFFGTFIMGLLSIITFLFALWMMSFATVLWAPNNKWGVSLYLMTIIYGCVIANNFYFMFKYAKLL